MSNGSAGNANDLIIFMISGHCLLVGSIIAVSRKLGVATATTAAATSSAAAHQQHVRTLLTQASRCDEQGQLWQKGPPRRRSVINCNDSKSTWLCCCGCCCCRCRNRIKRNILADVSTRQSGSSNRKINRRQQKVGRGDCGALRVACKPVSQSPKDDISKNSI